MKMICALVVTGVTAVTACGLLNGCTTCNCAMKPVYLPTDPTQPAPETQVIGTVSQTPLNYQWFFTNGTPAGATANFEVVAGTNGAPYYQWYKNTNSP